MPALNLTHPDEVDAEEAPYDHPIDPEIVDRAFRMAEPEMSIDDLHEHLETVQTAFEHALTGRGFNVYDPLDLIGTVAHGIGDAEYSDSPYPYHLHIEDGKHGFGDEASRRNSLIGKEAEEALGPEPEPSEITEKMSELSDEIDLDDYTEEEQYDAYGMTFGVWDEVAALLNFDRDSDELKAVKFAHELEFDDSRISHTEYGETGFIVGIPEMFYRGMKTEQRLFASFVGETKASPAQIVDMYGRRLGYDDEWHHKRGVSQSAVSQNRSKMRDALRESYNTHTIPGGLL